MKPEIVDVDVIAERVLHVVGEPHARITVKIGRPVHDKDDDCYFCPYEIKGAGVHEIDSAGGLDAVQAIQGAFIHIGGYVAHIEQMKGWSLTFADANGCGFPKP